ncbi:interferon regulatory factor 10 isoform X2 [Electrophorus electricus]|uniref:interferon regulatory factor 10 isoform X2 n=1 Tax=Electrophorus electricus TaxID=8005 RepID=UPI0015D014BC|nr:interferon regulatory factor 10 isoform X2 [Electrophorus electricus]
MDESGRNMRLREWLIAQIDSGKYAGLSWENRERTTFKIPWKHAAKQDYRQSEDAALFKAWAVYKGKFREGRDKADPSAWKTRLRCALNKSTDFQEVPERSQLDISEPYKVYHIVEDTERPTETLVGSLKTHVSQDGVYGESNCKHSNERPVDRRLVVHASYSAPAYESPSPVSVSLLPNLGQISDFRLQVCLLYHGLLVQKVISSSPEGCFILQGSAPVGSERIYGPCAAHKLFFPRVDVTPLPLGIGQAMSCLLPHLEKGVLVWVAPDGVFIKRFCQGRVYWYGPLAQYSNKPNKLERERTCKLLDIHIFLQELHRYLQGGGPRPRYEIDLCFGEEFPDATQPKSKKLITAQVVPLFAHELLVQLKLVKGEDK